MIKNQITIILLLLNLVPVCGQRMAVKHIDKLVAAINLDPTIKRVVVDSMPNDISKQNSHQQISVSFKDSKISIISFCDNCRGNRILDRADSGTFVDYYLENEKLCFVNHRYTDNSRPGSCGYVSITNKFYFKDGRLIKHLKQGYNPCDAFSKINKDPNEGIILQNFKNLLEIAKGKKATANYPIPANNLNFDHYFMVLCPDGTSGNNCKEHEVLQADSIAKMKDEFQRLTSYIKEEKASPEIDTLSNYKLIFIVENQRRNYIGGRSSQATFLKKCDENIKFKDIPMNQAKFYMNKYIVTSGIPSISEIGDTYDRSSFTRYYYEKTD